ncbi:MAG: hypothetical protein EWM45_16545 [Rhodopseudomonas palustris]|nr:hypothetical protein [Rhodopseudomonas faecalis]TAH65060.1 MAG: hypothetical protein EWM45_16545 [Rhodopseudomonas palustris]
MPEKQTGELTGKLREQPLLRLLAINLAVGGLVATLLLGGLLWLNPLRLRDLIFADAAPGTALGLLLFGFVITFGSAAMGTAIMTMTTDRDAGGGGGRRRPVGGALQPAVVPAPSRTPSGSAARG